MKICERCHKEFNCGVETNGSVSISQQNSNSPQSKCWCMDLPVLNFKTEFKDCLCPACLNELLLIQNKKASAEASNEDFYFDENGLMVMTAAYHIKRGFCCGNSCRHCPYPKKS